MAEHGVHWDVSHYVLLAGPVLSAIFMVWSLTPWWPFG